MPLTIVNVAYPLAPVSPHTVGGAEQIVSYIDAALANAGHSSIVIATGDSRVAGRLVPIPTYAGTLDARVRQTAQADVRNAIARVLDRSAVDVVHLHGIDFLTYLPPAGVPVLITLHLPADWYAREAFRLTRPQTYVHCVSAAQQRTCPPGLNLLPPISNGVAVPDIHIRKRHFALSLGRICPEKGFHLALEAAKRASTPWLLAGEVFPYPEHQGYFNEALRPALDRTRRYIGPVGGARKRRLLAAAQCVLIPSLAPETSSLVAMEALAHGTPVIAFARGALPDIVEHGRTGFLVSDVTEMADAIPLARRIDPKVCRAAARERFSLERMTAAYLAVYKRLSELKNGMHDDCEIATRTAR